MELQDIVVDFSYAIINACIQAFNECTIKTYLNLTITVLPHRKSVEEVRQFTS